MFPATDASLAVHIKAIAVNLLIPIAVVVLGMGTVRSETLRGRVVAITDGASLVLAMGRDQYPVRLAGIDAPEHFQPFGKEARANLSHLAFNREVHLACQTPAPNSTRICQAWIDAGSCRSCSEATDLGLAQISAGLAWWRQSRPDPQSAAERQRYEQAESLARLRRLGLWADSRTGPPWQPRQRVR